MHTLWITDYDESMRVKALKAIRAAREILADRLGSTLSRSYEVVEEARERLPVLVGQHEDRAVVDAAARALEVESGGALRAAIDLPDAPPAVASDDDEDFVGRTALTLMAFTSGNPSVAVLYAYTLGRNSGDPEFYEGVVECLLDAFPLDQQ